MRRVCTWEMDGTGDPCGRPAQDSSEYCAEHDPAAEDRQKHPGGRPRVFGPRTALHVELLPEVAVKLDEESRNTGVPKRRIVEVALKRYLWPFDATAKSSGNSEP